MAAAAGRARRYLAMSCHPDRGWMRLAIEAENPWRRLARTGFRTYIHPPRTILAVAPAHDLRPVLHRRGWIWQTAVLEPAGELHLPQRGAHPR